VCVCVCVCVFLFVRLFVVLYEMVQLTLLKRTRCAKMVELIEMLLIWAKGTLY